MDEQTTQAINYIQHQRAAGRNDDDIKASLRTSGWAEPAIDQLFAGAGQPPAGVPQPSAAEQPVTNSSPAQQSGTAMPTTVPTEEPVRRSRTPKLLLPKQFPKWAMYVVGGVVLLIIIILALIFINNRTHQPTPKQHADNQLRQADAKSIAKAIRAYATDVIYQLPTKMKSADKGKALTFCDDKCNAKTSESANLTYYQASHVTRHEYSDTLRVPDTETVYIVYNASCDTDHENIGDQVETGHASVAILYALAPYYSGNLRCQVI